MRVHFIAIGGAIMHNMAIALHKKGYDVSGSDDEIFDPARTRLEGYGLLPEEFGWFPEKINNDLDVIILGMHARSNNPELLRATEMGLKVFSFPEYFYEMSKDKIRVVIGGSHGKTTITSMILHVLKHYGKDFDYLVGAQISGFDTMVKITEEAPILIAEGDEYLSSAIDMRPKFHLYHPHIAVISGIAWDHINVFPDFDMYVDQFRQFIRMLQPGGTLIYCKEDEIVNSIASEALPETERIPYGVPAHDIINGKTHLIRNGISNAINVFGDHNLMNLEAARLVCEKLGISSDEFDAAISSFTGAARRLEHIAGNSTVDVFRDFAHSPSKLKATVDAARKQYPDRKLIAIMELHTFSSLNPAFLAEYKGTMDKADKAVVYFNPHAIEMKKMAPITALEVQAAFGKDDLTVITDSKEIVPLLESEKSANTVFLLMSSGNFDNLDIQSIGTELTNI
ncbi:MAG: peptidoglycan synthetase [Bacteroidetes bacterium]|nr:peptidoglycan synthetase [Bacteroidota bacterium]MBU1719368.1 peptidoglycan synthetase [Bacteroidota bacterium]